MRTVLLLIGIFISMSVPASEPGTKSQDVFRAPFDGDIQIIGTFCELRRNHFHGGLDIRTGGKIGRHVLAVGDGYISRINISNSGYGKALYIDHPNGYTSVYAHLNDFPDWLKWYIEKEQYNQKKYEIEIFPDADVLQVKKGQMVAYSGNTGASQGPHLHFEIRETKSEAPVNPLKFGIKMNDTRSPGILGLYVYSADTTIKLHNGHFPYSTLPMNTYTYAVVKGKRRKQRMSVATHYLQPGKYALGAYLKDYATSSGDNNGVNYVKVYIDTQLIYDCKIERILFSQMRMHNNYVDFRMDRSTGKRIHKMFIDNGNTLGFYSDSPGDGWFELNDSQELTIRIVAEDVYGHTRDKTLKIVGSKEGKRVNDYIVRGGRTIRCYADRDNTIKVDDDFSVKIAKGSLYSDYLVSYKTVSGNKYSVGNYLVPLDKGITLIYTLSASQISNAEKYTVLGSDGRKYGGTLKDKNKLHFDVKEFGTYTLVMDVTAPHIKVYSFNRNSYFSFIISDNLSGIRDFDFYVNDTWVLLEYDSKTGKVSGKLPNKLSTGEYTIKLVATDNRNNSATYSRDIKIP